MKPTSNLQYLDELIESIEQICLEEPEESPRVRSYTSETANPEMFIDHVSLAGCKVQLCVLGHAVSRHAQRTGNVVEETAMELGCLVRDSLCNPSLAALLKPLIPWKRDKCQSVFIRDRQRELLYLLSLYHGRVVIRTVFEYRHERIYYKPYDKCFLVYSNGNARAIRGNDSGFVKCSPQK